MRGDKTFAYDLVTEHGAVNSRVVLLLRSVEAKPPFLSFVFEENTPFSALFTGLRRDDKGITSGIPGRKQPGKKDT